MLHDLFSILFLCGLSGHHYGSGVDHLPSNVGFLVFGVNEFQDCLQVDGVRVEERGEYDVALVEDFSIHDLKPIRDIEKAPISSQGQRKRRFELLKLVVD